MWFSDGNLSPLGVRELLSQIRYDPAHKIDYFDSYAKMDALLKGGLGRGYGPAVYSNIGQNDE